MKRVLGFGDLLSPHSLETGERKNWAGPDDKFQISVFYLFFLFRFLKSFSKNTWSVNDGPRIHSKQSINPVNVLFKPLLA